MCIYQHGHKRKHINTQDKNSNNTRKKNQVRKSEMLEIKTWLYAYNKYEQ